MNVTKKNIIYYVLICTVSVVLTEIIFLLALGIHSLLTGSLY